MNNKNQLQKLIAQYAYLVEWSEEDKAYLSRCIELGITAHGKTQEAAIKEAKEAAHAGLTMLDDNEIPQPISLQSYSGKFNLRMAPEKHREVTMQAKIQGVSLNHYITSKL